MKKISFSITLLFVMAVWSLAQEVNNVSMVTYFPVSYVAYNQLTQLQQMDVGLSPQEATMRLGKASQANPLQVSTTTIKAGILDLYTTGIANITLNSLSLGNSVEAKDSATLNFKNVRFGQATNLGTISADILEVNGLTLLGKNFPSCAAVNANSNGNGQLAWTKLALGPTQTKELYLTCGAAKTCGTKPADVNVSINVSSVFSENRNFDVSTLANDANFRRREVALLGQDPFMYNNNSYSIDYNNAGYCGNVSHSWICDVMASSPTWQTGDWNTDNVHVYLKDTIVQSCADYVGQIDNSRRDGWQGNITGTTTCLNGGAVMGVPNYSACQRTVTETCGPQPCGFGDKTRTDTINSNGEIVEGSWNTNNCSWYAWELVNGSDTWLTSCNYWSSQFSSVQCTPSNTGKKSICNKNSTRTEYSPSTGNYITLYSAIKYECRSFSQYTTVVDTATGQCKHNVRF